MQNYALYFVFTVLFHLDLLSTPEQGIMTGRDIPRHRINMIKASYVIIMDPSSQHSTVQEILKASSIVGGWMGGRGGGNVACRS